MAWVAVAGAGVGLLGTMMNDDGDGGGQKQTATKEPWAEAAPWLKNQIAQGRQLQDYYSQNPFNAQQRTGYQNTFSDLDNFRSNIAPGLMDLANQGTSRVYQRQQGGAPGSVAGYGGAVRPGGMRGTGQGPFSVAQPTAQPSGGLMGAGTPSQYGLLDFQAQNPFTNGAIKQDVPAPAVSAPAVDPMVAYYEWLRQQGLNGYGGAEGMSEGGYGDGNIDGAGGYGGADNGY